MQVSKETIDILKNFATINSNILIRKGKTLSTMSTAKNIFAKADVAENFPVDVPIYDLNSLLALLTFMENQEVDFGESSLTISKNNGKFEYFYSALNVIVAAPEKTPELDNKFEFKLSSDDVTMITKAAAITSAPRISISNNDGTVTITVGDKKNATANSFKKTIGTSDVEFDCHMAVENFKITPGSYTVSISSKKAFLFKNDNTSLTYLIAMEPDSKVG